MTEQLYTDIPPLRPCRCGHGDHYQINGRCLTPGCDCAGRTADMTGASVAADPSPAGEAADPDDDFWQVTVEIPRAATYAEFDRVFNAVADAAYDAEPEERGWDIFIHGRGPRPDDAALAGQHTTDEEGR